MITPASISPIICGTFNLFSSIGANRIIKSTSENMITGFFRGNEKSTFNSTITQVKSEEEKAIAFLIPVHK